MESSRILDYCKYKYWYEAIRSDNFNTIAKELEHCSDITERNKLLNGLFDMEAISSSSSYIKANKIGAKHVWHLVATLCSEKTIKLFLSEGVDIHVQNDLNYNVVHSMIIAAFCQPECEDKMMENYKILMDNISTESKLQLLNSKHLEGLRPLEFAMDLATTGLFQGKIH